MAFNICFTFIRDTGNFIAKFQSTDGEEYELKYNLRYVVYGNAYLILTWKNRSSKLIRISSYSAYSQLLYDKTCFVKNDVTADLPLKIDVSHNVIVISITPHISLTKCMNVTLSEASSLKPNKTTINKDPNRKIKQHLSTDMRKELKMNKFLSRMMFAEPNKKSTEKEPLIKKKLEQLSTDMRNLLETGNHSDIVLTDGSKEILAHKLVLSVRSSVFAKMFQNPMKESRENRITIVDIPMEVLRELLNFMYTGTVAVKDSKMARKLYIAAEKYDVKDLKDICTDILKSVDLNNVLDTLLLADLYCDCVLKQAALDFVAENYSQLKTLKNWNNFMKKHQSLAFEILSFVVGKKL